MDRSSPGRHPHQERKFPVLYAYHYHGNTEYFIIYGLSFIPAMKWCLYIILIISSIACQPAGNYETLRMVMVEDQIMERGIKDPRVLDIMKAVPRHEFVPDAYRKSAYEDGPLPIGYGQTISQPFIVAFMTEHLQVEPTHKVLEIGTGSGYQAAVLGRLADHVYTIEIVTELARDSKSRLKAMGYNNVTVLAGDGYKGWPEEAPFDRIIVTAAPEEIPQKLVDQLKTGGRMVVPVGKQFGIQYIWVITKQNDGTVIKDKVLPVRFVPMVKGK